ncbi:hypothetical protein [Helicobacter aurati]|nr:hypothetical protein [Helicobacter aurati]
MKNIEKEMLVQKFSDYYCDESEDDEAKNFRLYDIYKSFIILI